MPTDKLKDDVVLEIDHKEANFLIKVNSWEHRGNEAMATELVRWFRESLEHVCAQLAYTPWLCLAQWVIRKRQIM